MNGGWPCDWCGVDIDGTGTFLEYGVDIFKVDDDEVCRGCWLEGHVRGQV